jgi:glycosyltransferase involved in cell wall biosynthesis
MIWMVSGLHDPRWLSNILENYGRQVGSKKGLIIVENGIGIGTCNRPFLPKNVIVLVSECGPAQPLNVALSWLRENGDPSDWFCKCDSDDYYGPGYLKSIKKASRADYAGRSSLYIKTMENRLWYIEGKSDVYFFHGPTIAGRISSALDFPVVRDWGEDADWCMAMKNAGRKAYTLPPEGVCYQRHGNYKHTWPCTDYEIRTSWNAEFTDLGPLDLDIVNGIKPRPKGKSLGIEQFNNDNSMSMRILKEKLAEMRLL